MHWMLMPLRRYADFQGRSRRLEYWMFTLFILLLVFAFAVAAGALGAFQDPYSTERSPAVLGLFALLGICWLGILIPTIAVTVRRLHDRNMSGWFYLIGFIPYVGGLILLVFMLLPGTPGENQYGPDPKDPNAADLETVFS